ncbi:conserved hypothetical protein [Pediculus humanus corporis]|uniref:PH domain-containing protein n=1 Tax=Pediculus humanus subsp. corporis TaxID=121224 RepID=E0W084_PEDHC|nr:uncharacterized protein Phum_PHUM547010 [Pediculus humanus corporis]EEB19040.1 conserved hypothetical protein [Pediculus humanus corporis]
MDWSDHALWWPKKNFWLTRTRSTLDQYGVQADALLHFTPMHKCLRVQLPDLRYLDCKVDFSIKTFNAVINLCKELGIRHPEELSFCKPLESNHLKHNLKDLNNKRKNHENIQNGQIPSDTNTFIATEAHNGSNGSLDKNSPYMCAPMTPTKGSVGSPLGSSGTWKRNQSPAFSDSLNGTLILPSLLSDTTDGSIESSLANSPTTPNQEARSRLLRPKSLVERARMNVAWLDSSLSIMEQGVREFDTLNLRFKFYAFYDLNPKCDSVRINQLYEQAKWQLLNEEIDCTEEEVLMFAALQVQINIQAGIPQPKMELGNNIADDDIDAALTDLQVSLEGTNISNGCNDITQVPKLYDYLRFLKPKRFTLKQFKKYWFTCRDLKLTLYKSQEDADNGGEPVHVINLRGCEVTPEVNIAQGKFAIKLEVASPDGMTEMWIRCDSEEQYAKWMAACRLGAKGRSLADSSYEAEVKNIEAFLKMQHRAPSPAIIQRKGIASALYDAYILFKSILDLFIDTKTTFSFQLIQRILEAHANVKDLNLMDAKMSYIKAWQSLPEFGISLFVINFMGHKKEELLGVAFNRIMRMDLNGDHLKTWRYNSLIAWNVNWEVKHMMIQHEEGNIIFSCLSADCKVIHEFIGGYIFLSMRSKEANQTLNEELFHKLTGGWV